MNKRVQAQQIEKYLKEIGHIRDRSCEFMQTLDALTGEEITCRVGAFKGKPAAAMIVGEEERVICLDLAYIEAVLDHCLRQSQFKPATSPGVLENYVKTMELTSGALIEAGLIAIEGEELVEVFFSNRDEPVVLEPGFLVELMLELHK